MAALSAAIAADLWVVAVGDVSRPVVVVAAD